MQKESWVNPKLEVRASPIGGRGVFAREPIAKGEILSVSAGRVVDDKTYRRLVAPHGDLCYNISSDEWFCPIDITSPSADWLVNHSCEPSAEGTAKDDVTLVARRDIAAGEEITYDYAVTEENSDYGFWCNCGAANCRGIITGNDWKIPELQGKYRGLFTKSIQEKINTMNGEKR